MGGVDGDVDQGTKEDHLADCVTLAHQVAHARQNVRRDSIKIPIVLGLVLVGNANDPHEVILLEYVQMILIPR